MRACVRLMSPGCWAGPSHGLPGVESDARLRVDVIEFVAPAAAIGFEPVKGVRRLLQRARARRALTFK